MFDWLEGASDAVVGGVMSVMVMTGLAEAPAERFEMTMMLDGLAEQCYIDPDIDRLWASVVNGEALVIPEDIRQWFGELQTRIDEDYRELVVPVKGLWRGADVAALAFIAGNDNGISLISVHFGGEGLDTGLFGSLAARSQSLLEADPDNFIGISTGFVADSSPPQYYCDFST